LLLHSAAYFVLFRNLEAFQTERGIFFYHLVSAVATTLLALSAFPLLPSDAAVDTTIGLIAEHGIYSVSFLELWALSDDSYSLAILKRIAAVGIVSDVGCLADLRTIGERKQINRLGGLTKLGLVYSNKDLVILTAFGRCVAHAARNLLRIVNTHRKG
jgi:hypothetical protein